MAEQKPCWCYYDESSDRNVYYRKVQLLQQTIKDLERQLATARADAILECKLKFSVEFNDVDSAIRLSQHDVNEIFRRIENPRPIEPSEKGAF